MKCFISHSGSDKVQFVDKIVSELQGYVDVDENSFASGSAIENEMHLAISKCNLFVVLLSEASLNSSPVKTEINIAKKLYDAGEIDEIKPLIIDRTITHNDPRIPQWLRQFYLRPEASSKEVIKILRQSLIELSWKKNPKLEKERNIFVGRNDLMKAFEERIDNFEKGHPTAIFASGLRETGRKTFLFHALSKSNIRKLSVPPITLALSVEDSIESLIIKLIEASESKAEEQFDLLNDSMEQKIAHCIRLIENGFRSGEVFLIDDFHCIVKRDNTIAPWFIDICNALKQNDKKICVAASSRPNVRNLVGNPKFYFVSIPELDKSEREGLFKRHLERFGLELPTQDFKNFANILSGFPGQARYAASLIHQEGARIAFEQRSHEVAQYSQYKSAIYLRPYEENEFALDYLRFLCRLDFFSLEMIKKINHPDATILISLLEEFLNNHICEPIGGGLIHYYRINEIIRDSILRGNLILKPVYVEALKRNLSEITSSASASDYDLSEIQTAAQEALVSGEDFPERHLIPAHFLSTLRNLYNERRHHEVVQLAERALGRVSTMEKHIEHDFRYFLCQSLARLKDRGFLEEIQKINDPEHNYLLGFYYRITGRYEEARDKLEKVITNKRTEQRCRGELTTVLIAMEEYQLALAMTRDNYKKYPANPYFVQSYIQCLLHEEKSTNCKIEIEAIIKNFSIATGTASSEIAREVLGLVEAKFEARYGSRDRASNMFKDLIASYPKQIYPLMAKLEFICENEDTSEIRVTIENIKKKFNEGHQHRIAVEKAEILLQALEGDSIGAKRSIETSSRLPNSMKVKLQSRIDRIPV